MKLVDIQAHLEATGIFSKVEAVLSLDEINKNNIKKPVAFIAPAGTETGVNERVMGATLQLLTETYSVIYCVPSIKDKSGLKANKTLQELIIATREDLVSFAPVDAETMVFAGGELMMLEGGFAIWHDQFTTQFYLEGNKP